jgi:F0F1-type ATP synthase assembly protein I
MARQDDNSDRGRLVTLGMEVAVGVGLGALVGNWLDRKYHWDPWGTVVGATVGFLAGIYLLVKEAIGANKKN